MSFGVTVFRLSPAVLLVLVLSATLNGQQASVIDLKAEHDPSKRSEKALSYADTLFDGARDAYAKGDIHSGDAQLEDMTRVLKECVQSLETANKSRNFKKAELHVAMLQRRMQSMVDDLNLQDRGWAEFTQRKVDEIHDELLQGVMRK